MSKRRLTLQVRIPPYQHPRNDWRYTIHTELIKAAKSKAVLYRPDDQLEIVITLYMPENQIRWHDVDNRLKDIMDTLQGRVGGSKLTRGLVPIIPNDHQIYKVTITKKIAPPQSHGLGHIIIKKHTAITSKFLYRTLKPHQFNKKSNMWTPSSEFILRVPESEKRLYEAEDPCCFYHDYQWPYRKGRHKKGEFPVVVVRKHFIDRGYKVWVSGQSKIGIEAFILAMFPGARRKRDDSYLIMVDVFGEETIKKFIAIVEQEKKKVGLRRHGGDPDLFVQNSQNEDERFFVEVKAEDFTRNRLYKDDLNDQQRLVFALIEKHLKCQVRIAKVQIIKSVMASS